MNRRPILAAAAILTVATLPTSAQNAGVRDMVVISGSCSRFEVSGISYRCKAAVYSHHTNGRTALQFDTPTGAIMFSGGSDSQIDPQRYTLNVDTIRAAHTGQSHPYKAQGRCVVILADASGDYVRSITCKATNGTERVEVEFSGDRKKIKKLM